MMRPRVGISRPVLTLPTEDKLCVNSYCDELRRAGSLFCAKHGRADWAQYRDYQYRIQREIKSRFNAMISPKLATKLYGIAAGDRIKFGISRRPASRLSSLQSATADELRFIGSIGCERMLEREVHEYCREQHIRGEWFRREGRALEIEGLIAAFDAAGVYALLGYPPPVS